MIEQICGKIQGQQHKTLSSGCNNIKHFALDKLIQRGALSRLDMADITNMNCIYIDTICQVSSANLFM